MRSRDEINAEVIMIEDAGQPPSVKDLRMAKLVVELLLDVREALAFPLIVDGEIDESQLVDIDRPGHAAVADCQDPTCHVGGTHGHD